MSNYPIISIIVPVYNVEKYLRRCIDSILNQTFENFELILIDDGSTDYSGIICDEYKKKDNRIVVIHKENEGAAVARNLGVDIAKGSYIGFVDSDDYIDKSMYDQLYEALRENNSDMCLCGIKNIYDDNRKEKESEYIFKDKKNYNNIDTIKILYSGNTKEKIYLTAPCNKLYNKELIKKVRYPQKLKYEDSFVIHKLLYECNKITYIEQCLYYYYQRENSTMNSPFSINDLDILEVFLDRIEFSRSINQNLLKEYSINDFVANYFNLYYKVKYILKDNYNTKKLKKMIIKNYHYILTSNSFSFKEKLSILIFILNEKFHYSKIGNRNVRN